MSRKEAIALLETLEFADDNDPCATAVQQAIRDMRALDQAPVAVFDPASGRASVVDDTTLQPGRPIYNVRIVPDQET